MRYFLSLSYFGEAYHGWQRQPNAISVQEVVEDALTTLMRCPISIVGAGRTDTGVHAREIYAHFDTDLGLPSDLEHRLNRFLPDDIAVNGLYLTPEDAHARFSAISRSYEYHVTKRKDPFLRDRAYLMQRPLDVARMNEAATVLKSYRDFECFSKSNTDVQTFNCEITSAYWKEDGDLLVFHITADRFLRNMVRAVVGTLLDVGLGKLSLEDVKAIIKSKDRSEAGVSVPAKGLYLTRVEYPEGIL
ncbi:tRNA pseudouridine(38-40) synthase TruA [Lentiprolixibacter aurantiacus]|uniref:tRNA pseudouridine synthase A n=1 Tax=Lentiprolixibacter aurantiacus TaxID=2993939 RepID=A0AAE3SPD3_9FLAO|nr:tRNA pseudouridine(38-40) synthase TruA [Lentiprolixibacter aurantiacus]MCX2720569.1 tRNA pseudouridine(38-40) synthase TruA [Lentiprolixibacter aurantiacus]